MSGQRNSKLTDARTRAALEALRMGCTREAAAGVADVHRATFYRWMDDATFRDEVEKAEAQAEAAYTYSVQAAVPKNWQAAAWWLERRRYQSYARRDSIDVRIDMQAEATKLAEGLGLDADLVLAEAVAILGGKA